MDWTYAFPILFKTKRSSLLSCSIALQKLKLLSPGLKRPRCNSQSLPLKIRVTCNPFSLFFFDIFKTTRCYYKDTFRLKPIEYTLWEIGLQEPLPIAKIDRYEEANQVDLINESIKYGRGSLPEVDLGQFGKVV